MKLGLNGRILGASGIPEDTPEDQYWAAKAAEEKYPKHPTARSSVFRTRMEHRAEPSTPAPPGISHPILHAGNSNGVISQRRPRPETSHQKAVNINRKMRIEHILHRQMLSHHSAIRKQRREASSSFGFMAMKRIKDLPDGYDTEHEQAWGPGGLVPNLDELEDFGEEALRQKKSIDRAVRRLIREETGGSLDGLVKGYKKRKRKDLDGEDGDGDGVGGSGGKGRGPRGGVRRGRERDRPTRKRGKSINDAANQNDAANKWERSEGERREEGLDDLDLDLLGESRDDDHDDEMDEDSGMEIDSEGNGDDDTEEEL